MSDILTVEGLAQDETEHKTALGTMFSLWWQTKFSNKSPVVMMNNTQMRTENHQEKNK
jgi:hypothetical protein